MQLEILRAAQAVWDYIGYDCLQALADEKKMDINRVLYKRADVIELVLDADRLLDQLRRSRASAEASRLLTYDARITKDERAAVDRVLLRAFPYDRYGM